ncbi:uncharacterized protein LOC119369921 [Jatropha curcas]|uniref:uncharacterized protein LOC119369921 n=1 Tax=Jatropha curcas TaxID=180498 RepID=UPI0018959288|nr:uncharacterized protein LOC119369921 [Jatropha curcas]
MRHIPGGTTVQQRVSADQRTWQFFLDEFKKKFITEAYLDVRRKEFLYLRQNRLSVAEYEREFTRLSRYGKGIVTTETERCKKFQEGLNDEIQMGVVASRFREFSALVEAAQEIERIQAEELVRGTSTGRGAESAGYPYPPCEHCGRRHGGDCWLVAGKCWTCGASDHQKKDCPRKARVPTQFIAGRGRVSALIDPGSSHSYISVPNLGLKG